MTISDPSPETIRLTQKSALIADHWNPRIIARYNGNEVRLVKIQGAFTWHHHVNSDELFLVLEGSFEMEFRDKVETLTAGDMIVVPRGVEHRPRAQQECLLLILDQEGEPNTGENPSHMTREELSTL